MRQREIVYVYKSNAEIIQLFHVFADPIKAAENAGWEYKIDINEPNKEWSKVLDDPREPDNSWEYYQ